MKGTVMIGRSGQTWGALYFCLSHTYSVRVVYVLCKSIQVNIYEILVLKLQTSYLTADFNLTQVCERSVLPLSQHVSWIGMNVYGNILHRCGWLFHLRRSGEL